MAIIDDKVVAMSFENKKFESGVSQSLSSLEKLKAALKFPNAGKELDGINTSAKKINLAHIARGVDEIRNKLGLLSVAATAAFATIATKAIMAGTQLAKSFTIDPLKQGFQEYTTNLNAIQTILANTQAAGTGLKDVNAALQQLNEYSDKTIYNFSQMAKNIGTFTAAGVDLDTAVGSIKGIANLAAVSGSSADQAATAMYQLSQAISAGRVSLMDWNSVVNAGMGGTVFQRALAQTAEAMGTLDDGAVQLKGSMKNVTIAGKSFRESLQTGPGKESWLTSEVLTRTLEQFTGDLSKAELAAMGFNEEQIKSIQSTATMAQKAATEVKTLNGVLTTARETAASGWAKTWQIIFGDFGEAKTLFTNVSNAINGFINTNADARNKVLEDWKALGGRTLLIDSIRTAFQNLGLILKPIKEAFRDIFPAKTGADLQYLTQRFADFAESLKPSATTVDGLKRTFRGLFALFSIGIQVIKGIFSVFGRLFGVVGEGSGGFLNFTGNIGDFLVALDKTLKEGGKLTKFFDRFGDILAIPLETLGSLSEAFMNLFSGFSPGGISDELDGITKSLSPIDRMIDNITTAWDAFTDSFNVSGSIIQPMLDGFVAGIQGLGDSLGQAASNINFEAVFAALRTGLFAALVVMFKQFLGKGSLIQQLAGDRGIFGNIGGIFDSLSGSMQAMQNQIKAKTLKEIAIAIALLAASVVALSFVDPERLKSSLTAMTVAFGQLLGAMAILGNISKTMGFVKMPVIAASMILLAGAITILSAAVVILAQLSWEQLAKGLGGVVVLLGAVSVASIPLSANSRGMIAAGIGITAMAIGLNLLALAVKQLSSLSWTELAKGLGAVAVGLGVIAATMTKMPSARLVIAGAGLIALAVGLNILAIAIEKLGNMDWKVLGKGLAAVAGSLTAIALAMKLMPKSVVFTAGGLLLVAVALQGITRAVEKMGGMSIEEIAKGLGTLAGSLIILAGALHLMKGTIGGALALTVAAAGLAVLAPVLVLLGRQSWGTIIKGLVSLAATLGVLGVAGMLLAPVIPALLGLGAALILIGGGLALAGAGIALISAGISALAITAPTGIAVLVAALKELAETIPEFMKNVAIGLVQMVQAFAAAAPQLVTALGKILKMLLEIIITNAPAMGEAFSALLKAGLKVITDNSAQIVATGMTLLLDLLKGIRNNIHQITTIVADIIVRFLQSLSNNMNRIVTAGTNLVISFVRGIVNNIGRIATAAVDIVVRFVQTIANNLGRIATAGISIVTRLLGAIAGQVGNIIKAGTDIIVQVITGIGNAGSRIVTAGVEAVTKFINAVAKGAVKLVDEGFKAIINFLNGIANAINQNAGEMRAAGARVAFAIVDGMTFGLASRARGLAQQAVNIGKSVIGGLKGALGIDSPSKEALSVGKFVIDGLSKGLSDSTKAAVEARNVGNNVISEFKNVFEIMSPSKVMFKIGQYVGQGFADGLTASADDIRESFTDLNNKLTEAMVAARETIAKEQEKLDKLRSAKKPDEAAIKKVQEVIKQNEDLLARSRAGHILLTKALRDEKAELISLANDYEKISEKLKNAENALVEARRIRDDALRGFQEQYSTTPEISEPMVEEIKAARDAISREQANLDKVRSENASDLNAIAAAQASVESAQARFNELVAGKVLNAEGTAIDQLATYMQDLKTQSDAVSAFNATLQELRKLGLDDATYQKLLREGTANQSFANQLLAGGKTAIKSLNTLDTNLMKVSKTLATNAAKNLFQAGVDAAEGLVKGLKNKRSEIRKEMEEIAREMIRALKKELKIKSPSEEFAEIGRFSMEGMAKGFSKSAKVVVDAINASADDALDAMKKSMAHISDVVTDELNPNPVITPVLDLTRVRAQSSELSSLVTSPTIALDHASSISTSQVAAALEEAAAASPSVKFEQNNYSPKALTDVEIYRQTKNLMSQLRSSLDRT